MSDPAKVEGEKAVFHTEPNDRFALDSWFYGVKKMSADQKLPLFQNSQSDLEINRSVFEYSI
jgi:hypothetical protein